MKKISVDTNILISIFVFPGTTVINILEKVMDGELILGISDEILREFIGVCVRKFNYEPEEAVNMADKIREISITVYPQKRINIIKDEPDNRILECAEAFGADCIISGDRHLLSIKKFRGIEILTPAEFIIKYG